MSGGEIVSMDSRQIYKGMDIGTAKPSAEELLRAKHHMLDVAEPGERFTVVDYAQGARDAIRSIIERGEKPIVVGGTFLYLSALAGKLEFCGSDEDPEYRAQLLEEAQRHGAEALHDKLRAADPDAAEKIHPNDMFRVARALEALKSTGKRPSEMRTKRVAEIPRDGEDPWEIVVFTMEAPRKNLYDIINKRTAIMYNNGLMEETREIASRGTRERLFLEKTIGYSEALKVIEGQRDVEWAVEETAKRTRWYAKRQLTWLRAVQGAVSLDAFGSGADDPLNVVGGLWKAANKD
jgi:tRNA dimethylallyltransferase